MGQALFHAPEAGRIALHNLRHRLRDPKFAEETARALQALERELFLKEYERAHAELHNDPQEWAEALEERRAFDGTLMDGLHETEA